MAKKNDLEKRLADLDSLRARGVVTDEEYQARRAAILADTSAGVEKKGGGGIFKWGMMGCFGVLAGIGLLVVVVIAVIAAAANEAAEELEPNVDADVHVALKAGSSGTVSEVKGHETKVTVLQIADNVTSTNQFAKPADGKKWWGMEVVVENVGTKEITSLTWKLRDSNDGETDRAFVVGAGQELEFLYDLTPGGKTQGWVYFEIPADATPKWVRADPNVFMNNDLYFDAQ